MVPLRFCLSPTSRCTDLRAASGPYPQTCGHGRTLQSESFRQSSGHCLGPRSHQLAGDPLHTEKQSFVFPDIPGAGNDGELSCLTVFDLGQVPHHHVSHRNLDDISFPHHRELLLLFNPTLQTSELLLFGPVVEGCHQDNADHRQQDGCTLDPPGVPLAFVLCTPRHVSTDWRREEC